MICLFLSTITLCHGAHHERYVCAGILNQSPIICARAAAPPRPRPKGTTILGVR